MEAQDRSKTSGCEIQGMFSKLSSLQEVWGEEEQEEKMLVGIYTNSLSAPSPRVIPTKDWGHCKKYPSRKRTKKKSRVP